MSLNGGGVGFNAGNTAPASAIWSLSSTFQRSYTRTGGVNILGESSAISFTKSGTTFTSTTDTDIGEPSTNRRVWVFLGYGVSSSVNSTVTSVTIAGQAGAKVASSANDYGTDYEELTVWYADVPSGTTAGVALTVSSSETLPWDLPKAYVLSLENSSTTLVDTKTLNTEGYDEGAGTHELDASTNTALGGLVVAFSLDRGWALTWLNASEENMGYNTIASQYRVGRWYSARSVVDTISENPTTYTPYCTINNASDTSHLFVVSIAPQ